MRLFLLSATLTLILTTGAIAQEKSGFVSRIADSLSSGEVVAVVVGGVGAWGLSGLAQARAKQAADAVELGRLKFKQELELVTKTAIKDSMGEVVAQLSPAISALNLDIQDIKRWLASVDDRADQALKIASVLERTQTQWLKRAESQISTVMSADHPTLIKNLFFEEEDDVAPH